MITKCSLMLGSSADKMQRMETLLKQLVQDARHLNPNMPIEANSGKLHSLIDLAVRAEFVLGM